MDVKIGVDPGARDTGIIAIFSDGTVKASTVHNDGPLLPLAAGYLRQVGSVLDELAAEAAETGGDAYINVESITKPSWHVQTTAKRGAATNPEALIGTAQLLGAIMGWYDVTLVPPRRNGSRPLGAYPIELVSEGERRKKGWEQRVGTGKLRHQRSAWDIANYVPIELPTHVQPGPAPVLTWK